jgi:hypothetical protein
MAGRPIRLDARTYDSKFSAPPGWTIIKSIAENDYNLAAGRYKPMVAEAAPDDDPAELIQDVLDIEKDITKRTPCSDPCISQTD